MKLIAAGLAISLALAATPASAQVGGPSHGPKAAVGGAASRPAGGAVVGGPMNKGLSSGAGITTKPTSTIGVTTKSGPTTGAAVGTTATTAQTGAGKPKH